MASTQVRSVAKHCLKCDYALDGLTGRACPECGAAFHPDDPATYRPCPRAFGRRSLLVRVAFPLAVVVIVLNIVILANRQGPVRPSEYFLIGAIAFALFNWLEVRHLKRVVARVQRYKGTDHASLLRAYRHLVRTWRPLIVFTRRVVARGGFEAQYAVALYTAGREEEALKMADLAIRRSRRGSRYGIMAMDIRTKALVELARYDDARKQIADLLRLPAGVAYGHVNAAHLEQAVGRLDEAVAHARQVLEDPESALANEARVFGARALCVKGSFDEALAILEGPFIDAFKLVGAKKARTLMMTAFGRQQLEHIRKSYAAAIVPMLRHQAAMVHNDRRDFAAMQAALDEAEAMMDAQSTHIWVRHAHLGLRAVCAAATGDGESAERSLRVMREEFGAETGGGLVHASLMFEGAVALALGRAEDAVRELQQAVAAGRYPISRHGGRYWLAVAAMRAGQDELAREQMERVIADGFETWMRREALLKMASAAPAV